MTIIAGTIIPIGSPVIVAAANTFGLPVIPLAVVATVGFTIASPSTTMWHISWEDPT